MPRPAVFLDRDGVLNVYLPDAYVRTPDELRLLPGIGAAVRRLNDAGRPVFLITNQQGVGKGLMSAADLDTVHAALVDGLAADGARLDGIYACPHLAADDCECRKPRPGLLLRAAREHDLDLSASWFVGDTRGDSGAARAAGVGRFALVLSGKSREGDARGFSVPPDLVAPDLTAAVAQLLEEEPPA